MSRIIRLAAATTAVVTPATAHETFMLLMDTAISQIRQLTGLFDDAPKEQLYWPFVATMTDVGLRNGKWSYTPTAGETYVPEETRIRIAAIAPDHTVRYVAGSEPGVRNGHVRKAKFRRPQGLVRDPRDGKVYVVDTTAHQVRVIDPETKMVRTLVGSPKAKAGFRDGKEALFNKPHDIALWENMLYIADIGNQRVRQIDLSAPELVVTTLAGNGTEAITQDGPLDDQVTFKGVHGLEVGPDGSLYIADSTGHKVTKIPVDRKEIITIAGNGEEGFVDGQGEDARFSHPTDMIMLDDGNLIVADVLNLCFRAITPTGHVHTIAGTGENSTYANYDVEKIAGLPHRMYKSANGILAYNLYAGQDGKGQMKELTLSPSCYDDEMEYEGNDMEPEPLTNVKSPNECQWICSITDKCEAFTFHHAQKDCMLKTKMTDSLKKASRTTSGPRSCMGYASKTESTGTARPTDPSLFTILAMFMTIVCVLSIGAFGVARKRVHFINDAHKHGDAVASPATEENAAARESKKAQ